MVKLLLPFGNKLGQKPFMGSFLKLFVELLPSFLEGNHYVLNLIWVKLIPKLRHYLHATMLVPLEPLFESICIKLGLSISKRSRLGTRNTRILNICGASLGINRWKMTLWRSYSRNLFVHCSICVQVLGRPVFWLTAICTVFGSPMVAFDRAPAWMILAVRRCIVVVICVCSKWLVILVISFCLNLVYLLNIVFAEVTLSPSSVLRIEFCRILS